MGNRVRDVMTPDPVIVSPEATLREVAEILSANHISGVPVMAVGRGLVGVISDAARAMLAESVHRLLVVDGGRLEGIITGRDLMQLLADDGGYAPKEV